MMVMTAKVNIKKVLIALAVAAGVILGLILLLGGGNSSQPTAAPSVAGNDGRVQFLQNLEWQVNASPTESGQVRIPKEQNQIFTRYNDLQKSAGYDLSQYAGKTDSAPDDFPRCQAVTLEKQASQQHQQKYS